jgi:hypothetical protein
VSANHNINVLLQEWLEFQNGFLQTAVKPWCAAPGVTGQVLSALTSTMPPRFSNTFPRPAKERAHHHADLAFVPTRVCWLTTGRSGREQSFSAEANWSVLFGTNEDGWLLVSLHQLVLYFASLAENEWRKTTYKIQAPRSSPLVKRDWCTRRSMCTSIPEQEMAPNQSRASILWNTLDSEQDTKT